MSSACIICLLATLELSLQEGKRQRIRKRESQSREEQDIEIRTLQETVFLGLWNLSLLVRCTSKEFKKKIENKWREKEEKNDTDAGETWYHSLLGTHVHLFSVWRIP